MVDVFEEVEEQLRSARYKTLALKALPWIIGVAAAALIATLAYWGYNTWRDRQAGEASQKYAAALEAYGRRENAVAFRTFGEIAESGPRAYRAIALMQQAGMRMEDNKIPEAVALFDAAAEAAPDELIGDIARLKSAFALFDTASYADLEKRLTPLTEDERPYRIQAKEALAFAKLMAGKGAEARGDFAVLSLSPDSSDAVRQRARTAMDMIDSGSAASIPAAVKAAAALPAQPPVPAQPGAAQ